MEPAQFTDGVREALLANLASRRTLLGAGTAPVGWKIAGGMPGVRGDEGVDGLVFGYLTERSRVPDGGTVTLVHTPGLAAEVELAIEVGGSDRAVDDDQEPYIARVGVALEIVDTGETTMEEALPTNSYHRHVAFGPLTAKVADRTADASLSVPPDKRVQRSCELDAAGTVRAVQQMLLAFGERLHAGDLLIGGSLIQLEITVGGLVTAEINGLGSVSLDIELK